MFHILSEPSELVLASVFPSGEKAIEPTPCLCPKSELIVFPLAMSTIRIVLLKSGIGAIASVRSSGESAHEKPGGISNVKLFSARFVWQFQTVTDPSRSNRTMRVESDVKHPRSARTGMA